MKALFYVNLKNLPLNMKNKLLINSFGLPMISDYAR